MKILSGVGIRALSVRRCLLIADLMDRLNQSFHIRRENISDITDAECISIRNLSGINDKTLLFQQPIKLCKRKTRLRIKKRSNNRRLLFRFQQGGKTNSPHSFH